MQGRNKKPSRHMSKYLTIYEEAVSQIWLCNCSILNFLIFEENWIFFFYQFTLLEKYSQMNNGNRNFFLIFYNYFCSKFDLVFTYIKVACALPISDMARYHVDILWKSIYFTPHFIDLIHSSIFFVLETQLNYAQKICFDPTSMDPLSWS